MLNGDENNVNDASVPSGGSQIGDYVEKPSGRPQYTVEGEIKLAFAQTKVGMLQVLTSSYQWKYFDTVMVPDLWARGIINPIPKVSSNDHVYH